MVASGEWNSARTRMPLVMGRILGTCHSWKAIAATALRGAGAYQMASLDEGEARPCGASRGETSR